MEDKKPPITIQDLYPGLFPEEQEEAEYNLHRYLGLVKGIHDRLEREGKLGEVMEQLRKDNEDEEVS